MRSKRFLALFLALLMTLSVLSAGVSAQQPITSSQGLVRYQFSGLGAEEPGFAEGTVTIDGSKGSRSSGCYVLYWANGSGVLPGYTAILSAAITGGTVTVTFPAGMAIPPGATTLALFESESDTPDTNLSNATLLSIPQQKQFAVSDAAFRYTFAAFTDVHVTHYAYGAANWSNALALCQSRGIQTIVLAGDQTYYGRTSEWELYNSLIDASPYTGKIYDSVGNHELYDGTELGLQQFMQYSRGIRETGATKPYYEVTLNGDHFLFMALEGASSANPSLGDNFSSQQLDWLEGKLAQYAALGENVFLIEHAAFRGWGSGDRVDNPVYSQHILLNASFPMNVRFQSILKTYRDTVMFTGHTHIAFSELVNYSNDNGKAAHMLHVSSLGSPRYIVNNSVSYTEYPNFSEGYFVDVYEKNILLKGTDLYANLALPLATYITGETPEAPPEPAFPLEGEGNKAKPYLIQSEKDFHQFTELLKSPEASQTDYLAGLYFQQTADLDMTGYAGYQGATLVFTDNKYFAGVYNGGGHTVRVNIVASESSSNKTETGVFPRVTGKVLNLGVTGSVKGYKVGGVARTVQAGGVMANCWTDVTAITTEGDVAAALAGTNYGAIVNCFFSGTTKPNRGMVATSGSTWSIENSFYPNDLSITAITGTTPLSRTAMKSTLAGTLNDYLSTAASVAGVLPSDLCQWEYTQPDSYPQMKKDVILQPQFLFEGEGSKEAPYLIQAEEDFYQFTELLKSPEASQTDYLAGLYFRQTADLDMTGYAGYQGASLVSTDNKYFAGIYNGGGHTIRVNIVASESSSNKTEVGVFPRVTGKVLNLGVTGSVKGYKVGGVARTVQAGGVMANCWTDVTAITTEGDVAAALAGTNYGAIVNCFFSGTTKPNRGMVATSGTAWSIANSFYPNDLSISAVVGTTPLSRAAMQSTLAGTLNDYLSAAADVAGVDFSDLCQWEYTQPDSYPQMIRFGEEVSEVAELVSSPASAKVNEVFTVTVNANPDVTGFHLVNETGRPIGVHSTTKDGTLWQISTKVGTAGVNRQLRILPILNGQVTDIDLIFTLDIIANTETQHPLAEVTDARFAAESVAVNQPVEATVSTNTLASYLNIANEKGAKMGKTLVKKTVGVNGITWIYSIAIGTSGQQRAFTFSAAKEDLVYSPLTAIASIDVVKVV